MPHKRSYISDRGMIMSDISETETLALHDSEDNAAVDEQPAPEEACGKAAHCPFKHHAGLCGKNGKCPVRNISKDDTIAGVITLAGVAILTVATYYIQYALTKAAVKSALKETRLR